MSEWVKIEVEMLRSDDGRTLCFRMLPDQADVVAFDTEEELVRFVRMDSMGFVVVHQVKAPAPDDLYVMEIDMPEAPVEYTEEPGDEIHEVDAYMVKYRRVKS